MNHSFLHAFNAALVIFNLVVVLPQAFRSGANWVVVLVAVTIACCIGSSALMLFGSTS